MNGRCNSARWTRAFETYAGISFPYFFLGRYDQALHWAERALRQRPRFVPALIIRSLHWRWGVPIPTNYETWFSK